MNTEALAFAQDLKILSVCLESLIAEHMLNNPDSGLIHVSFQAGCRPCDMLTVDVVNR